MRDLTVPRRWAPCLCVHAALLVSVFVATGVADAAPGDLDATFAGGGLLMANINGGADVAVAVAVQPDGKILSAGPVHEADGVSDSAVVRHNADGSLDPSFGGDGKVLASELGLRFDAVDLVLQGDGKVILVGSGFRPSGGDDGESFEVIRLNPDGSFDQGYAGGGLGDLAFRNLGEAVLDSAGRLVVAGSGGESSDFWVQRLTTAGVSDESFAGGGVAYLEFGDDASPHGIAVDSRGRIVVAGATHGRDGDFAVVRLLDDGSLDRAFAGGGRATTDFGGMTDRANDVMVQPDGKIVAVGYDEAGSQIGIARYTEDGALDPSFSQDGTASAFRLLENGSLTLSGNGAKRGLLQGDGRIVVAAGPRYPSYSGRAPNPAYADDDSDFAVARFLPDGTPDTAFSGDGLVRTDFRREEDFVQDIASTPSGAVVAVGGATARAGGGDFGIARYVTTGLARPRPLLAVPRSNRTLRVTRRGRVFLRLGPASEKLRGEIVLQFRRSGRLQTVGSVPLRIDAGERLRQRILLGTYGRALTKRVRRLRGVVTIQVENADGAARRIRVPCRLISDRYARRRAART